MSKVAVYNLALVADEVAAGGIAAELRRCGFDDRDIWDISAVAAFFNMTNRVASATDMRPNSVYHPQAR